MQRYLIVEFDIPAEDKDRLDETLRRANDMLNEGFSYEKEYYDWVITAEEWHESYPVSREAYEEWKALALTRVMEVKA